MWDLIHLKQRYMYMVSEPTKLIYMYVVIETIKLIYMYMVSGTTNALFQAQAGTLLMEQVHELRRPSMLYFWHKQTHYVWSKFMNSGAPQCFISGTSRHTVYGASS
jgi:hypothetical protein